MSKLSTQMASCCRGVRREEASHKLNLKMRLALDYHHSPVPFLVLHRVWAGEGNFEKQSPVFFLVLHRVRAGEGKFEPPIEVDWVMITSKR